MKQRRGARPICPGTTLRHRRYMIEEVLSERPLAGTATYRATTEMGAPGEWQVAIKTYFPQAEGRLGFDYALAQAYREFQMLSYGALHTRAIPPPSHLFAEGGRVHLVRTFLEGPTLEDLFAPDQAWAPPWPQRRLLVLAKQLASLLNALHTGSPYLLVRDLKPSNVVVERDSGRIALIDLGAACILRAGERVPEWLWGRFSSFYAPPEQQAAAGEEDRRADLYAMGAILRSAAVTRKPQPGANLTPYLTRQELLALGYSNDVAVLIGDLLQLDPDQRPATAREVDRRVARLLDADDPA